MIPVGQAAHGPHARHENAATAANEAARLCNTERRDALGGKKLVGDRTNIGCAVDKRAVEVEDDRREGHRAPPPHPAVSPVPNMPAPMRRKACPTKAPGAGQIRNHAQTDGASSPALEWRKAARTVEGRGRRVMVLTAAVRSMLYLCGAHEHRPHIVEQQPVEAETVLHRKGHQWPHGGELRVPRAERRLAILGAHGLAQRLCRERDAAGHGIRPGGILHVRGLGCRLSGAAPDPAVMARRSGVLAIMIRLLSLD